MANIKSCMSWIGGLNVTSMFRTSFVIFEWQQVCSSWVHMHDWPWGTQKSHMLPDVQAHEYLVLVRIFPYQRAHKNIASAEGASEERFGNIWGPYYKPRKSLKNPPKSEIGVVCPPNGKYMGNSPPRGQKFRGRFWSPDQTFWGFSGLRRPKTLLGDHKALCPTRISSFDLPTLNFGVSSNLEFTTRY